ncbi:Programmed cell death protein 7 [Nymphon striatum]|nr:Programmed cell death protein 7 [Nymphon striatum]
MNSNNNCSGQPVYNVPTFVEPPRLPYFQGNSNQTFQASVNQTWTLNSQNYAPYSANSNHQLTQDTFFAPQNVSQPRMNYNVPPPPIPPLQNVFTRDNHSLQNPPMANQFHSAPNFPNQFSNSNSYVLNNKDESIISNMSEDEQWLSKWLKDIGKSSKVKVHADDSVVVKISDAKTLLQHAYSLFSLLTEMKHELKNSLDVDPEIWTKHESVCNSAHKQLSEITKVLNNEKLLKSLTYRIKNRKKKRIWQNQRKLKINEEKSRNEQKCFYLHKQIDENIKKMADVIIKKKKEEEMKKEADSILSEVRKKLSEGSQVLHLLNGLEKLRELRKESARRKGLYSSKEMDDEFQAMLESLKKLIDKQISDYRDEEKTLTVMIESEQEVKRAKQKSESQAVINEQLKIKQSKILTCLFGKNYVPAQDPLFTSWNYFTQADSNLESLVCIRKNWDMFLNDSEQASSIPIEWVIPPVPSSQEWGKYLVENN